MSADLISVRSELVASMIREFVGPGSEGVDGGDPEAERISESPLKRYALAILYPQKTLVGEEIEEDKYSDADVPELVPGAEIQTADEEGEKSDGKFSDSSDLDDTLNSAANQFCPSSYGMTFFLSGVTPRFQLRVKAAKYVRLDKNEAFVKLSNADEFVKTIEPDGNFEIVGDRFLFLSSKTMGAIRERLGREKYEEYNKLSRIHDKAKNFLLRGFKREPLLIYDGQVTAEFGAFPVKSTSEEQIEIHVKCRSADSKVFKITVSVVSLNTISGNQSKYSSPEACYFQNSIEIESSPGCAFQEISKMNIASSADPEDDLLYKKRKVFAVGHGCSANWNDPVHPHLLSTTFTPMFEVPRVESFPERIKSLRLNIFSMSYLAFGPNKSEILTGLTGFVLDYEKWIDERSAEKGLFDSDEQDTVDRIIDRCRSIKERLKEGVEILRRNDEAWSAFRLANEAMTIQRFHTEMFVRNPNENTDKAFQQPDNYTNVDSEIAGWRPFQLAFLLLSVEPTVNQKSAYREISDLIWFPTGGGKTEAYLGVIAFTIFYRRIVYGDEGRGTSVIMRYTLRLLTSQQYQRASTLICACEFIRKQRTSLLGDDRITIGLWVGRDNTPNSQGQAAKEVAQMINSPTDFKEKNPFQVFHCPWCGTQLLNETKPAKSGYVSHPLFHFRCTDGDLSLR